MGWFNIYAVVYNEEHSSMFDFSQRYGAQFVWIMAALVIGFVIMTLDSNAYHFFAYIIYGLSILLLISVLFVGKTVNAARAWIEIGPLQLQPSELVKITTALVLARLLDNQHFRMHNLKNLLLLSLVIFVPVAVIVMQNDTGSAVVYAAFFLVLYREGLTPWALVIGFVSLILFFAAMLADKLDLVISLTVFTYLAYYVINTRIRNVAIALGIFAGSFLLLYIAEWIAGTGYPFYYIYLGAIVLSSVVQLIVIWSRRIKNTSIIVFFFLITVSFTFTVDYAFYNILEQHQRDRIDELLGIRSDPLGTGYNVNQSKIAIGSGGFWGKGYLDGTQTKYNFVPEQSTDFIFCTVGEEWGFVGSTIVLIMFLALLLRLIFLAERQRSIFSRVYGYSVASILFFHIAINVGMTLGMVPVIGIPLPFFSYGGSSLWSFTILLFIFIRLDSARMEKLV
jgi:rod shape determining protein RodA